MIFVGIDWAERHHDLCVIDEDGQLLAKGRIVEGLDGVARLHSLIGKHAIQMRSWSASRLTAGCLLRLWWRLAIGSMPSIPTQPAAIAIAT